MGSILDGAAPSSRPDNRELIKLIGERFISRKDVKAIQHRDGSWSPATDTGKHDGNRLPFTLEDFNRHLAGSLTLGHYMIGTDDTCKLFAFDIDLKKEGRYYPLDEATQFLDGGIEINPREVWLDETHPGRDWLRIQLRCMAEGLAININRRLGIPVAVLDSGGKGLHVYGFTGTLPAVAVRASALSILDGLGCFEAVKGENFFAHKWGKYENIEIEVFPKQGSLEGKDLGNLMRLPLGKNQKTGKIASFISMKNGYDQPWLSMDPLRALTGDLPWE